MALNQKWILLIAGLFMSGVLYFGIPQLHTKSIQDVPLSVPVYPLLDQDQEWLNVSSSLHQKDLKGRVLLLDFWTYCCVNCMHILPQLHELEKEFGQSLTVIGVHSGKFMQEKSSEAIRSAIARYEIHHPVVNDPEFKIWSSFGVTAWPTLILINPEGVIEGVYPGEGHFQELRGKITSVIKRFEGSLNTSPLPMALEAERKQSSLMSFPGKIVYDQDRQWLWISDSNHHRVLGVDLKGQVQEIFDSEAPQALQNPQIRWNRPQGLAYRQHQLYVADTENHLVKKIDLKSKEIQVIAGTGVQGLPLFRQKAQALTTPLSSPWDLGYLASQPQSLIIAMAGTHQLWVLDLQNQTLDVLAGNGRESIDDGAFPQNSLSQPSGLSTYGSKLYFVDSETSSLRLFENGLVRTLLGHGLFHFGFRDGQPEKALLQHPLGVWADQSGVYIADTYNHSIRVYDPMRQSLKTEVGRGKPGYQEGSFQEAMFNEPSALVRVGDFLYVTDTNNHQIRVLDLQKKQVSTLKLRMEKEKGKSKGEGEASSQRSDSPLVSPLTQTRALSDSLPRLKHRAQIQISSSDQASVGFELEAGWKFNPQAPSWLAWFETVDQNRYSLVKEYEPAALQALRVKIPYLKLGKVYRLQGTLYTCKKGEESVCTLQSLDYHVQLDPQSAQREILIHLQ